MVLAGLGVGASLLVEWFSGINGLDLFTDSWQLLGESPSDAVWQALVIVLGAAIILVIGLSAFVRAKSRQAVGLIALFITGAMSASVVTLFLRLTEVDFELIRPGFYVVIAATVLGLIGAVRCAVTPPRHVRLNPTAPDQSGESIPAP